MSDVSSPSLPYHWIEAPLSDLVDSVQYGHTASAKSSGDGPRFLRITDIQNGNVEWRSVPVCAATAEDLQKYELASGDIVFARTGATTGKSYLIRGCPEPTVFASYLIRLRLNARIDPRFLWHFFQTSEYWHQIAGRSSGIAQPGVNATALRTLRVPVAPPAEQNRIVEAIETQLTRLDAAVAALERVQANLKRYRASVLKAAVEGRLVPTEAELARREGRDYEPASVLLQRILVERRRRGAKCGEPIGQDVDGLPGLPTGWCWVTAETLASDTRVGICAGPFGTIFKARDFRPQGVPIIFLRHVKADHYLTSKPTFMDADKWEQLFKPYSVWGGELLVTKLGEPPGECAIFPTGHGPGMLTPDVIKLVVDEALAVPRFVMHYLNSTVARRVAFGKAFGTTRLRLTLPLFRGLRIPLPPLVEQERIVAEVDRGMSIGKELANDSARNIGRSARLRQSILKWAFEGKLADQDPADEPASVLLERIRAARAAERPAARARRPPKRTRRVA